MRVSSVNKDEETHFDIVIHFFCQLPKRIMSLGPGCNCVNVFCDLSKGAVKFEMAICARDKLNWPGGACNNTHAEKTFLLTRRKRVSLRGESMIILPGTRPLNDTSSETQRNNSHRDEEDRLRGC